MYVHYVFLCMGINIKQMWLNDNNWGSGIRGQEFLIFQLFCEFQTVFKFKKTKKRGRPGLLL